MAGTMIVKLGRQEAIDVIKNTESVSYQHGYYNPCIKRQTWEVIDVIKDPRSCPYGADVWKHGNTYLVLVPCKSDML